MGFDLNTAYNGAVVILALLATVSLFRFGIRRYREVPHEYRFATYPTLMVAVAFILITLGAFLGILDSILFFGDIIVAKLIGTLMGAGLFILTVASLWALELRKWSVIAFAILALGLYGIWTSPTMPFLPPLNTILMLVMLIILGLFPVFLYGYLYSKTKKTTVFGLFLGLFLVFLQGMTNAMPTTPPLDLLVLLLHLLGLFGYAIITVSFLLPERTVGGELFGYSIALVIAAVQALWTLMWFDFVPLPELYFATATQIAAAISFISAAYLWGRYRKLPHTSTFLLFGFFLFIAIGYVFFVVDMFVRFVPALSWIPSVVGTLGTYLGFIGVAFAAASAIYAMEWRTLTLLPFLIAVPLAIIAVLFFPDISRPGGAELFPANVFWWMTIGLLSLFFFIPIILYSLIYSRLRKEPFSGRGKALGLSIGLFLIFPAHITFVPIFVRATIRILAFTILLVALTGWLDRFLDRGNTQTEPVTA